MSSSKTSYACANDNDVPIAEVLSSGRVVD
jgi:hypothetical protein